MKIGNLGEYETRIALRVLDFVAFGPLKSFRREYPIVTRWSLEEYQQAAWHAVDMEASQLEPIVKSAMFFAVGGFPHRLWTQMERWTRTTGRELVRISEKLSKRPCVGVVRSYVSIPPVEFEGRVYRAVSFVQTDGMKSFAVQEWKRDRWKAAKGEPSWFQVANSRQLNSKEIQVLAVNTDRLPNDYDPRK